MSLCKLVARPARNTARPSTKCGAVSSRSAGMVSSDWPCMYLASAGRSPKNHHAHHLSVQALPVASAEEEGEGADDDGRRLSTPETERENESTVKVVQRKERKQDGLGRQLEGVG